MRDPESWRALPGDVRRRVLRDARHGLPPRQAAVARAAREWAEHAERKASRLLVVYSVLVVVLVAVAVAVRSRVLPYTATSLTCVLFAAWLGRRQARQVLGALARRPPDA